MPPLVLTLQTAKIGVSKRLSFLIWISKMFTFSWIFHFLTTFSWFFHKFHEFSTFSPFSQDFLTSPWFLVWHPFDSQFCSDSHCGTLLTAKSAVIPTVAGSPQLICSDSHCSRVPTANSAVISHCRGPTANSAVISHCRGHPDPYHGDTPGYAPCGHTPYPGYPPHRTPPVPIHSRDTHRPCTVRQASLGLHCLHGSQYPDLGKTVVNSGG